jgi:hypothetical protein
MSFFWYNHRIIADYLRAKFQTAAIDEYVLGNESCKKLRQLNHCFSNSPWGVQHDITGHVKHPFDIAIKNRYQYTNEERSFTQISLDTADKIIKLTDRPIAVFWSGGIDSTVALSALAQQITDQKRLTVVCNQHSIDEFPSMFAEKIKGRMSFISPAEWDANKKDYFSVTGDGGDTVWGVIDDSFWHSNHDRFDFAWQDCIDHSKINDLEFVEEFCSWSGVDIKSWLDLRIWFYLCCKWQDKCMRPYYLRQGVTDKDIVSFYDIDCSFQNWTMNNLDKIIGKQWEKYKVPAKEFIYQYHDDIEYLKSKSKVDSDGLNPGLISKTSLQSYMRIVVPENYNDKILPSWPFVDYAEIEDFNDEFQLIPCELLQV